MLASQIPKLSNLGKVPNSASLLDAFFILRRLWKFFHAQYPGESENDTAPP